MSRRAHCPMSAPEPEANLQHHQPGTLTAQRPSWGCDSALGLALDLGLLHPDFPSPAPQLGRWAQGLQRSVPAIPATP